MVYIWTMAMQFSFKYCIVPMDHKSEDGIKAIAGAAKALTGCYARWRSTILTLKVAALFVDNTFIPLV